MKTPHTDELVRQGIDLQRHYVYFYCAPSRSSLMSGRLPFRVNQVILGSNIADWDMPKEMTALPQKLKEAGYATHATGSCLPSLFCPALQN